MGLVNRKIVLVERPKGRVSVENFTYVEEEIGDLPDGCVLIEVGHLGIDAFIRTTLNEDSFHQGAQIGGAIPALGVGVVLDKIPATGLESLTAEERQLLDDASKRRRQD